MLQKELAKRLKARYDTKMDGNEWLEVSSDGIPLCRIKYNGQFLSNADQNLSDEYRSKIADIQDEISTVREYVGLYEHAPQMKADGVSDYRQLAAKNIAKANYTLLFGAVSAHCRPKAVELLQVPYKQRLCVFREYQAPQDSVILSDVSDSGFTHWLKIPYITYTENTE